jgi:2-keto-4-pentenoate hydratase/2-oxohepta-3-ene-1,7-dioic acid hydratase in catechol pathway
MMLEPTSSAISILNDLTARDLQYEMQGAGPAKARIDGANVLGPVIVTDELATRLQRQMRRLRQW